VSRFVDDTGLDVAPSLRDYLAQHGPCRDVALVFADAAEGPDFVVSGKARAHLYRSSSLAGVWPITLGIIGLTSGGIIAGGAGHDDCSQFANASDCESRKARAMTAGKVLAVTGLVLTAAGAITLAADRRVTLEGKIEADVEVSSGSRSLARWTVEDKVVARGK